jgi:hypothetical protein
LRFARREGGGDGDGDGGGLEEEDDDMPDLVPASQGSEPER